MAFIPHYRHQAIVRGSTNLATGGNRDAVRRDVEEYARDMGATDAEVEDVLRELGLLS